MATSSSAEFYGALCAYLRAQGWLDRLGGGGSAQLAHRLGELKSAVESGQPHEVIPDEFQDLVMASDEVPVRRGELQTLRDIFLGGLSNLFSKNNYANPKKIRSILKEDVLDLYRTFAMDATLAAEGDDVFVYSDAEVGTLEKGELVALEKRLQSEDIERFQALHPTD